MNVSILNREKSYDGLYKKLVVALPILFLIPHFEAAFALLLGIIVGNIPALNKHVPRTITASSLLKYSVVLMGFGMHLAPMIQVSQEGFIFTAITITTALVLGKVLGKLLGIDKQLGFLISCGTSICGGSAIAAAASATNAKTQNISIALGVIFLLNSIALLIFPPIGHLLNMSQTQFGYFSALAIHDTTSVVGACSTYGDQALQMGTMLKCARALWIVPLTLGIVFMHKNPSTTEDGKKRKTGWPYFILFFIGAILLVELCPQWQGTFDHLYWGGKKMMLYAIFLTGLGINKGLIQHEGTKPIWMGVGLWVVLIGVSLYITLNFVQ
ncbi:putative sulfate exporter family transporter [Halosquirtibacter laminarini]|uniref:Sulfate exporter family transporter n=1 Tax=Halosquirtibacter laminarini TaxID=3374600 RepID=A0AC61NLS3_9BACT|nr:putative sulfate exporter family transporter [Prolixibacteraceae bacterium]